MPDPTGLSAYARQIEAARNVGMAMTRTQAEAFLRLLEAYAEEMAARVAAGLRAGNAQQRLELAREIIRQLVRDLAVSTRNGVTITSNRVAEMYARATGALLEANGLSVGTLFPGLGSSSAAAVLSRPELAASFVSVRRASIQAVDQILTRGLLRGATSTQLAMELRLRIMGADAFPAALLLDRRRIGYEALRELGYQPTRENLQLVRQMARSISDRAQLIARTEPMNAEWEAHMQAAADSPVVQTIQWELSARHPHTDVCDLLAEGDWYGLGPGRYDPRMVPPRPHPRCLCRHRDIIAPVAEWGRTLGELPTRRLEVADMVAVYELPPSQADMITRALQIGEARLRQQRAA